MEATEVRRHGGEYKDLENLCVRWSRAALRYINLVGLCFQHPLHGAGGEGVEEVEGAVVGILAGGWAEGSGVDGAASDAVEAKMEAGARLRASVGNDGRESGGIAVRVAGDPSD